MKSAVGYELPETVKIIENAAFSWTHAAQSIIIPDSVTEIERNAFADCRQIHELTLPQNLTTIGSGAFMNTGITNLIFPENVVSISPEAFFANYDYWKKSQILNLYCNKGVVDQCETALQWKKDLGQTVNVVPYQKYGNSYYYDGKFYASPNDIIGNHYIQKRIYTIDEANAVAGKVNSVKIRYR